MSFWKCCPICHRFFTDAGKYQEHVKKGCAPPAANKWMGEEGWNDSTKKPEAKAEMKQESKTKI